MVAKACVLTTVDDDTQITSKDEQDKKKVTLNHFNQI